MRTRPGSFIGERQITIGRSGAAVSAEHSTAAATRMAQSAPQTACPRRRARIQMEPRVGGLRDGRVHGGRQGPSDEMPVCQSRRNALCVVWTMTGFEKGWSNVPPPRRIDFLWPEGLWTWATTRWRGDAVGDMQGQSSGLSLADGAEARALRRMVTRGPCFLGS